MALLLKHFMKFIGSCPIFFFPHFHRLLFSFFFLFIVVPSHRPLTLQLGEEGVAGGDQLVHLLPHLPPVAGAAPPVAAQAGGEVEEGVEGGAGVVEGGVGQGQGEEDGEAEE